MAGVNKAIVVGNLGIDPELRYTQSGAAVCNLRVATAESWTDKSGEKQERTEWHNIVVFGRQAENCEKFLKKGRQVYVEGRLQTRSWEDKEGNTRYTTEIVANTVQFLGGRDGGDGPSYDRGGYDQSRGGGGGGNRGGGGGGNRGGGGGGGNRGGGFDQSFDDDDIPF